MARFLCLCFENTTFVMLFYLLGTFQTTFQNITAMVRIWELISPMLLKLFLLTLVEQ